MLALQGTLAMRALAISTRTSSSSSTRTSGQSAVVQGPTTSTLLGQRGCARYPTGSARSPESLLESRLHGEALVCCLPGMEGTASIPCREDKPGLTESGSYKDSAAWRRDRTHRHRGS